LKKPSESAGRNPFLSDHQASQGRQERIPDDAGNPFLPEHQASHGRQEGIPDDAGRIRHQTSAADSSLRSE
jgi:hypothetical protein